MRRRLAAALIAGAAFLLCTAAGAAPFSVLLGSDRVILDTPPGFSETAAYGSPRLTEIAENLAEASSRVLAFAISDADARRFSVGDALELRNYLLAVSEEWRGSRDEPSNLPANVLVYKTSLDARALRSALITITE